jgi:hypothetical protein
MKGLEMNSSNRLIMTALAWVLLCACFGCATPEKPAPAKDESREPSTQALASQKQIPAAHPPGAGFIPSISSYYPTPTKMDLCGEAVPLDNQDVFERFDKEFTIVVYNHAQVYLWLKRMERYFPWIEERLHRYGLPDDLKYVVVAESDLVPNVASSKGAAGPWQFMPNTGSSYGLPQRGSFDSRYDFERSTESALRLLDDLRRRHGSWAMAIAAYNCGDKRIMEETRAQRVSDYYHLKLPQETERYVFRILAIKEVLGNPTQYGYSLPKGHGYPEQRVDRVNLSLSAPMPIQDAAEAAEMTYREFKKLNPTLRADHIPAGACDVRLPEGKAELFEERLSSIQTQSDSAERPSADVPPDRSTSRPPMPKAEIKPQAEKGSPEKHGSGKSHTVKKGDTLSEIAKTYRVSIQDLQKANQIKGKEVQIGQKLRIP